MSKMLGVKIGISASVIPVLALAWAIACHGPLAAHHADPQKNGQSAETQKPHLTKKSLNIRIYKVPEDYSDVAIFTDPENASQHCIAKDESGFNYSCYPNAPGFKADKGGPLDLTVYETAASKVKEFTDPENPALYCLGNEGSSYNCFPKPQPQPK